jgi:arylsulfatase
MLARTGKDALAVLGLSFILAVSEFLEQFYLNFEPSYALISRIPGLIAYNFILHICLVSLFFLVVSAGLRLLDVLLSRLSHPGLSGSRVVKVVLVAFACLFLYYWNFVSFHLYQLKYLLFYFLFMGLAGGALYFVYRRFGRLVRMFVCGYGVLLLLTVGGLTVWSARVRLEGEAFAEGRAAGLPNIIYIVIDTLRADALSCYGNGTAATPNMDSLASDGILFENVFSSSSWTIPGTATLLASRYPSSLNMFFSNSRLPEETALVSEVMKQQGYVTAAVIGNPLVNEKLGFNQGFDYFDCWANGFYEKLAGVRVADYIVKQTLKRKKIRHMKESQEFFPWLGFSGPQFLYFKRVTYRRGEEITDQAVGLIRKMIPASFFLYLHYLDPHEPYLKHPYEFLPYTEYPAETKREQLVRRYLEEVEYSDKQVGCLIRELKDRGIYRDTVIILTADHGEQFYEHGKLGHSRSLYNEELRIPLIIKGIDGEKRVRISRPISAVDILPTLFDILGIGIPSDFEGRSLKSANYENHPPQDGHVLSELARPIEFAGASEEVRYFFSLLDDNFKYIITLLFKADELNTRADEDNIENEELYDLKLDRGEKNNRLAEKTEEAAVYRRAMLERYNKFSTALGRKKGTRDKNLLDLLKGLGYI